MPCQLLFQNEHLEFQENWLNNTSLILQLMMFLEIKVLSGKKIPPGNAEMHSSDPIPEIAFS